MSTDQVRLTIADTVDGPPRRVPMPYARALWDDVDEADRDQLRVIARYRYAAWVRDEYGITLSQEHLGVLPVTAN